VRARLLMEEGIAAARETGDRRCLADALGIMGLLHMNVGDYTSAQGLLEESLHLSKEVEDRYSIAYRLADLGLLAIRQGRIDTAGPLVEESLALSMQTNHQWFIASCLERLGEVAVAQNQSIWAAQLWGSAAAIRARIGAPVPNIERAPYETAVATARIQLSDELFTTMWKIGSTLTAKQSIAAQTSVEVTREPKSPQSVVVEAMPAYDASLTQREIEVLHLVAAGLTNAQVAKQLVISPRTVQTHLSSIYHKLDISSRSAATRYAIKHGLA
jgi:DNA-binding CsgD family transcriptional regulator